MNLVNKAVNRARNEFLNRFEFGFRLRAGSDRIENGFVIAETDIHEPKAGSEENGCRTSNKSLVGFVLEECESKPFESNCGNRNGKTASPNRVIRT